MHRGHQSILNKIFLYAKCRHLMSSIVTFDPHPAHVLNQGRNLQLILSNQEKKDLVSQLPFDSVLIQRFDRLFSQMSAEDFVERVLIEKLKSKIVIVGKNFRFGFEARGDLELLHQYKEFQVESGELIEREGEIVSSSRIRAALSRGDLIRANDLLGYQYYASGVVVHGDGRGAQIGFPTANLDPQKVLLLPFGVYGGFVEKMDTGEVSLAAINYGLKPTFSGSSPSLEAHLLDFDGDLYGHRVQIYFAESLRSEMKFDSVTELTTQIKKDVDNLRQRLNLSKFESPRFVLARSVEDQ